jgi:4-hydroxyphenylpyruvate dioxygenase-like putative hemolysin
LTRPSPTSSPRIRVAGRGTLTGRHSRRHETAARVAFSVDDVDKALEIAARHGCRPLRGVATYEDVYKLTYVRGPSGIIAMLAEELKKN